MKFCKMFEIVPESCNVDILKAKGHVKKCVKFLTQIMSNCYEMTWKFLNQNSPFLFRIEYKTIQGLKSFIFSGFWLIYGFLEKAPKKTRKSTTAENTQPLSASVWNWRRNALQKFRQIKTNQPKFFFKTWLIFNLKLFKVSNFT